MTTAYRSSLKAVWREFKRCAYRYAPLYHEQWEPTELPTLITTDVVKAFREAHSASFHDPWDEWDHPLDGHFFGRFSGSGEGIKEFKEFAESAFLIVRELRPNLVPACDVENLVHHGWLYVVHEMARCYPTPLLRSRFRVWNLSLDPDSELDQYETALKAWGSVGDRASYPAHPFHNRMVHNLFTSSMAAIELIVDPDRAPLIGDWLADLPVVLDDAFLDDDLDACTTEQEAEPESLSPSNRFAQPVSVRYDRKGSSWHFEFVCGDTREQQSFTKGVRGFEFYAMLLDAPGRRFSSLELVRGNVGAANSEFETRDKIRDEEYEADIQRRLQQIAVELKAATGSQRDELEKEQAFILEELRRGTDNKGRSRDLDDEKELARKNVVVANTRARSNLYKNKMPTFARYLKAAVKADHMGFIYDPAFCSDDSKPI